MRKQLKSRLDLPVFLIGAAELIKDSAILAVVAVTRHMSKETSIPFSYERLLAPTRAID